MPSVVASDSSGARACVDVRFASDGAVAHPAAVTAVTAVEQCLAYGTPTYLLRQALERGHRQGYLTTADRDRLEVALEARHVA